MEAKEARLSLSRRARPLGHHLIRTEEKRRESEQAKAEYQGALKGKEDALETLLKAREKAGEIPALETESRNLRERRPLLLEALQEEETLRRNLRETGETEEAILELNKKKELGEQKFREKEKEIEKLRTLAEQTGELDRRWEKERAYKDALVELKKLILQAESENFEKAAAAERIKNLEERREELERRGPVLMEELRRLQEEKQAREKADMASHLAAGLKPGEPCPVCGSLDHPLPAAETPLFDMTQRLESLEGSIRDAGNSLAALREELQSRLREEKRRDERLDGILKAAKTAAPEDPAFAPWLAGESPPPSGEETARRLESHIADLNELSRRRGEAIKAGNLIPGLYREREALEKLRGEIERDLAALLEKRRNLAAAAEELRQKRGRLLPEADFPGGGKNAKEALKYLEKRLGETERLIEEYREVREKAGRDLAAAEAGENAARLKLEEGEKQRDEAAAALENALKDSPFPSADALREAVLDGGEEAVLEEEITRWKEDRSRLLSLGEELKNQLQGLRAETSGMEGSAKDAALGLETLRAGQEEAEAERDRAQRELSALERDWEALKNARERHETLTKTSARLNALADDLSGKNPRKRPFDSWLLSQYLAEVAAFASIRLEKMSEYRYSLLLESGREGGRGYTGLDLAVFDAHTGRTRPCATLS